MAKNVRTLMGSLPIIAKMLGQRYGVKVTFGGSGAYTNGKTINLPAMPSDDPDLVVLVNGYLDHEAGGHCRYTDFEVYSANCVKTPFERWVKNALEDIRIETALSRVYPGCKQHLAALTAKLVERGDTKRLNQNSGEAEVLTAYILWRLRSEVLGQSGLDEYAAEASERFDEIFPRGTKTKLTALMGEVRNCNSTASVIALAARIVELLKQEQEDKADDGDSQDSQDSGDTSDSSDGDDSTSDGQSEPDTDDGDDADGSDAGETDDESDADDAGDGDSDSEDDDEANDAESDSDTDDDTADSDDFEDSEDAGSAGDEQSDEDEADEAGGPGDTDADEGEQTRRDALEKAMSGDEDDFEQGVGEQVAKVLEDESLEHSFDSTTMAEPREPSALDLSYGAIDDRKVRQASARLRSRLAGLIQAQTLEHHSRARTGKRIDRRMLPRIGHGDPKLFTAVEETPGVDTAVTVLLDASGSMNGRDIAIAREAALAAAYALEETEGTNTSVFAFPDGDCEDGIKTLHRRGRRIDPDQFCVRADGPCTPLAEAAWGAAWDLLCAEQPRKMLIVITDGKPDDWEKAEDVLNRMRAHGVETIGIGINMDINPSLLPESKTVGDVSELSNALFSILEKKLVV